ncbi:MAG: glycosyltransferase [Victivallaceae bacterium]
MRLLHVMTNADIGGVERLVAQVCSELNSRCGVESDILCYMRGEGTLTSYLDSLQVHRFGGNLNTGWDCSPSKLWRIFRLMRSYDVIHIHAVNLQVGLMARLTGKKIIFTEHGGFGFGNCPSMRHRIAQKIKGFFLRNMVDRIIFNSSFSQQVAISRYGRKMASGAVIYNGVEPLAGPGAIDGDTRRRIDGKFVIGVVARFAKVKKIDRLIRAFATFADGRDDALLLLVGDGPLREEYERQTGELKIGAKVHFAGFRQNIYDYIRAMDLCVLPSANEAFGLSYVEALNVGKPAVVFADGGGLAEIAMQFDPADVVKDEAGLVRRLAHYESHRGDESKAAACREYAAKFTIGTMAQALMKEYRG